MMKIVALLLVFGAVVVAAGAEKYTTKYDNIDIDEILRNDRLYLKYFNCIMSRGKCTPDGKELKNNLPDAILTDCSKCSEKQKTGADKVLKYMLANKKADYSEVEKVYDPAGTYRKRYE